MIAHNPVRGAAASVDLLASLVDKNLRDVKSLRLALGGDRNLELGMPLLAVRGGYSVVRRPACVPQTTHLLLSGRSLP